MERGGCVCEGYVENAGFWRRCRLDLELVMSRVEQIESQIKELTPDELMLFGAGYCNSTLI